jgi:hypothetical protein
MQNLALRYARHVNTARKRVGHLSEGRYKAFLVDQDRYGLETDTKKMQPYTMSREASTWGMRWARGSLGSAGEHAWRPPRCG